MDKPVTPPRSDAEDASSPAVSSLAQWADRSAELEAIFDAAPYGIVLVRDRIVQRCNRRFEELLGYGPGELLGLSTRIWYVSDEDWQGIGLGAYEDLAAGRVHRREQRCLRKGGSVFWGEISGRAFDQARPQAGSVWILEDISLRRRAERQLRLAQSVFENTSEAILITDADNNIVSVNQAFEAITGYRAAEVQGKNPRIFKSGRHDAAFYRRMWESLASSGAWSGEIWDRRRDGQSYPKWVHINVVRDAQSGEVANYIAVFSDISERKAYEERIRHLAHHDALTGLANRAALDLHLERALAAARRDKTGLCLMLLDLDDFKPVNDRHGHAVGDELLVYAARRMQSVIREADLAARLGGDEFVVLLEGMHRPEDTERVAGALLDELSKPYALAGVELRVVPSIGVACYPRDGEDGTTLMRAADSAMYRAKGQGGRVVFCGRDG
jgi:diguanylate cyclase (GGDEF)-like protein/PAS domain S-box-containing protein